ncbi:hypothetical protein DFQ29_000849, partial [Apophysomyces sp. BC1021]
MHRHFGAAKGIHFDGSLSEENAVELINEYDIGKIMKIKSVQSKPLIECMVRKTMPGASLAAHASLHDIFSKESTTYSGFMRGAVKNYVERNGGDIQPATEEVQYFVMHVIHRELVFDRELIKANDKLTEAVRKAVNMDTGKEKYRSLQNVFGYFGYYYPSIICLGGRAICKVNPNDPSSDWMVANGVQTIDRAFKRATHINDTYIETVGGSTMVTGCQEWISSIHSNQARIQFRSMKPIYDLLDEDLRLQVIEIYDRDEEYADPFPNLTRGIHFDGEEASEQAIEFSKSSIFSKLAMLKA